MKYVIIIFCLPLYYSQTLQTYKPSLQSKSSSSANTRRAAQVDPSSLKGCQKNQFTCASKKCITHSLVCNGVNDCGDNSDESIKLCQSLNIGACMIPENTHDKSYLLNCQSLKSRHNEKYVPEYSLLSYTCQRGYTLDKQTEFEGYQVVCKNGSWYPGIVNCKRICSKPKIPGLTFKCHQNGKEISCSKPLFSGTVIHLSCENPLYQPHVDRATCDQNGVWSSDDFRCLPKCGLYNPEAKGLFKGTTFPWNVYIYFDKNTYTGVLISSNLVLTEGYGTVSNKKQLSCKGFEVNTFALRTFAITEQRNIPVRQIFRIGKEMAIFVLTEEVKIGASLLPVCLDWSGSDIFAKSAQIEGNIVLTGKADPTRQPVADEVVLLNSIATSYKECSANKDNSTSPTENQFCVKFPGDYKKMYQDDEVFSGTIYLTSNSKRGSTKILHGDLFRNGDFGTGFVTKNAENGLYYLQGLFVTNTSTTTKLFANVRSVISDIRKVFELETSSSHFTNKQINFKYNEPDDGFSIIPIYQPVIHEQFYATCGTRGVNLRFTDGCILPKKKNYNFDFKVTCISNGTLLAYCRSVGDGSAVPEQTFMDVTCHRGFIMDNGRKAKYVCFNSTWTPDLVPCYSSQKQINSAKLGSLQTSGCPRDQFLCSGRCISHSKLCDGTFDCDDYSDENINMCTSVAVRGCRLPEITDDRSYILNCKENDLQQQPNTYVQEFSVLSQSCRAGYGHESGYEFHSVCLSSVWTPEIVSCQKTCKLPTLSGMSFKCYRYGTEVNCSKPFIPGTTLRFTCTRQLYRPIQNEVVCDENGAWSSSNIRCEPECGIFTTRTATDLKGKLFPWTVFIHRELGTPGATTFIGTLIGSNLVLTDRSSTIYSDGLYNPSNLFQVNIYALRDNVVKKTIPVNNIERVGDFAILVLNEDVPIRFTLLPACIDFSLKVELSLSANLTGKIFTVGFINTPTDLQPNLNQSNIFDVHAYHFDICSTIKNVSTRPMKNNFCVDYPDGEERWKGDFGTAFLYKNPADELFYIRGIFTSSANLYWPQYFVDTIYSANEIKNTIEKLQIQRELSQLGGAHAGRELSLENLSSSTKVDEFLTIGCEAKNVIMKLRNGCNLPTTNKTNFNYKISCLNSLTSTSAAYCQKSGNSIVPEFAILSIDCNEGYTHDSEKNKKHICFNGLWYPEISPCKKSCPRIRASNVKLTCTYKGNNVDCSRNKLAGVVVKAECLPEYVPELSYSDQRIECLESGEWSDPILRCIAVCGQASAKNVTGLIHGGHNATYGDYPWHVSIYDKSEANTLICGGTIITEYAILTAAHCFVDTSNVKRKAEYYEIAVSKVTRSRDTNDSALTKFYQVEEIHFDQFQGVKLKYQSDIAILQLKEKIVFNALVIPACLYYENPNIIIRAGALLEVSGFGIDDSLKPSSVLKAVELPYVSVNECLKIGEGKLDGYLKDNQFCAGTNKSLSVDSGDSGGGLLIRNKSNNKYYVVGIVSYSAQELPGTTVITNVNSYLNWIKKHTDEIRKKKDKENSEE